MAKFTFNLSPRNVPLVTSNHRSIVTKIPVPESLPLLEEIKLYESSNALEQLPVVWDRAENHQIFDEWGNTWIDFTSSIFVTNSGHGNEETISRIKECINKPLLHSYYYPTRIRAQFLKKLLDISPDNLEKAIILSVGTEATERAIKIARIFGESTKKGKNIIVGGDGNYHGKTLGAQMMSGNLKQKEWKMLYMWRHVLQTKLLPPN